MFINRPLIHGRSAAKQRTNRNSSSVIQSKNKIRIKTLPSSIHYSTPNKSNSIHSHNKQLHDMTVIEGNLIGIKDIREMMDGDAEQLRVRLEELEEETQQEEKRLLKGFSKLMSKKSSISPTVSIGSKQMLGDNNKQIRLQDEQQRAYKQCVDLLMHQKKQQQKVQQKLSHQFSLKLYQLQQTRIQLQQLRKSSLAQLSLIHNSITKIDHQSKTVSKRISNKQRLIQQIQAQKQRINLMNQKLFASKQQSMKQKNSFVEIQAEQIRLIKEMQAEEEEENKYNEEWEQFQYYKKVQRLKGKLLKQKAKQAKQIDQFFTDKISQIVRVRVSSDQTDNKISQLNQTIEQQQAIIEMLTKKSSQQDQQQLAKQSQTAQHLYKLKYNQIFSSESPIKINSPIKISKEGRMQQHNTESESQFREIDHWQNYKFYLAKILSNEKKLNQLDQSPSDNSSFIITHKQEIDQNDKNKGSRRNSTKLMKKSQNQQLSHYQKQQYKKSSVPSIPNSNNAQSSNKEKPLFSSNKTNPKLPQNIPHPKPKPIQPLHSQIPKSQSPLPKLIKMQGNLADKHKIKSELTKFTNQQLDQSVQLQTVRTSQCDDGDVIEVEFKGIKPKGKQYAGVTKNSKNNNSKESMNSNTKVIKERSREETHNK